MTCSSCVHHIESSLKKKRGVLDVSVALATGKGKISYDSELTGARDIIDHINDMGFESELSSGQERKMLDHAKEIKRYIIEMWSLCQRKEIFLLKTGGIWLFRVFSPLLLFFSPILAVFSPVLHVLYYTQSNEFERIAATQSFCARFKIIVI